MRRRRNPQSTALAIVGAVAPLVPYVAIGAGAWWLWRKFASSSVAAAAAHAASAIPEAYGQAARTALDPSAWRPAYQDAEAQWQAQGEQGSPIAQPYWGPAGRWGEGWD
jgi:hypothetical protein